MDTPILLSDKNIPESLLVGKGTMTVLECKSKEAYNKIEQAMRGSIFHLEKDGRFFVKVGSQELKILKPYIEQ